MSGSGSSTWLPSMLSLLPLVGFPTIFGLIGVLGARLEPVAHMGHKLSGLGLHLWLLQEFQP